MIKVGITGQEGFIGQHAYNYLNLKENVQLIDFKRDLFNKTADLEKFVSQCDVILHLAAMNRHEDPQVIYDTNVGLVEKLIAACKQSKVAPKILFSSTSQESRDNLYGASKKKGRELLEEWASTNNTSVTGMIIPNVFGPFGKPFYNSVFATFCHQVINGEEPTIIKDGNISMIYVNELVEEFYRLLDSTKTEKVEIKAKHFISVSGLLAKLKNFYELYVQKGEFPSIDTPTDLAFFNSFICYLPNSYYPRPFTKHTDNRGSFVEIVRAGTSGQSSYSTTVPGVTRGNHFHTRKAERFAVIKGTAKISVRKIGTDKIIDYIINGETPAYVDMKIWHTHNISNIGDDELLTLFWINEPYNSENADTYYVEV
jgi:UDP-2-acetamido-2,6-beta-L-arabino-hexul-4-ose reductase